MHDMSCGKELTVVNINKQKVSICARCSEMWMENWANPQAQLLNEMDRVIKIT